jgi:hypothetical protein
VAETQSITSHDEEAGKAGSHRIAANVDDASIRQRQVDEADII